MSQSFITIQIVAGNSGNNGPLMGELIQIYVGQAGVQIANACWELYCLEHHINANGIISGEPAEDTFKYFSFFKGANKVAPRAILVDSEPSVIDQINAGPYACLHNANNLISGKEDSGSIFSRGFCTVGSELIDVTMEAIRKLVENCSDLRGFLIYRSLGGGTGSGFGTLIEDQLRDNYERISKMEFVIFPSALPSSLIVEPYNVLLGNHLSMDNVGCSFILGNEALYHICREHLHISEPSYIDINKIIAQVATTFTSSRHIGINSNISLTDFQTNLVPYPRIRFPLVSYAPFFPGNVVRGAKTTTTMITKACFHAHNQLVQCNPLHGKYMSCLLLYRGRVTATNVDAALNPLRNSENIQFVDWQPTDFKIGINEKEPCVMPCGVLGCSDKALLTLSNNTIMQNVWSRLLDKFKILYRRNAYVHHYIKEGLDKETFTHTLENISTLIADYKEIEKSSLSSTSIMGGIGSSSESVHDHDHIWRES